MKNFYKSVGWDFKDKLKEISENEYFLVAYHSNDSEIDHHKDTSTKAAFLSFRDDYSDDDRDVTYIYEIQVESEFQGQKIGKSLLEELEKVVSNDVDLPNLLMCTVQSSNERSLNFFKKSGFLVDQESPDGAGYEILSKQL